MEESTFKERLARASRETLEFTRKYVVDELPEEYLYIIFPNKHGEAKRLVGDAEVYPEDSLPTGQFIGPLDADAVTTYLWRNGKVPEWINISVDAVESNATVLQLWCCGHFTSLPANGYNAMVDPNFVEHTPFSIHSPSLPKDWERGNPKFELKDAQQFR